MQINEEKQPDSGGAGVAVPISASLKFSSSNSDARSTKASSSVVGVGQHHKRTGSGTQTRPSKHFIFDYKPLTADQHDDNEETAATDGLVAAAKHAGQQPSSSNSFASTLRRSLSPSSRLYSPQRQQHAPLSPRTEHASSPGAAFLLKAKTVLGKKLVGVGQHHEPSSETMTSRDLLTINRASSSAKNIPSSSATANDSGTKVPDSEETTSRDRVKSLAEKRRKEVPQKNVPTSCRGLSTSRGVRAVAVAENNFENYDDDDDISLPYNADEIQTHIMPHGPAPEKDLQHLFDAPLQHRVPVDESEARKLERDLKNLMEAFETGHGDPFGLENDPVVQTMHELRQKQEYITTQMFALDHTEYWNAENRFGMQKMKGQLNNMIAAVDDLCQSLRQLPSHEDFDIQLSKRRPQRQRSKNQNDAGAAVYDAGDFDPDFVNDSAQPIDDEISSAEISDVDLSAADDGGGITFKIPSSSKAGGSQARSKPVHDSRPAQTADLAVMPELALSSRRPAHKRSVSHPDPPKGTLAGILSTPVPSSVAHASEGGPRFAVPQAPPRASRRVKTILPTGSENMLDADGSDNADERPANFQGGGDNSTARSTFAVKPEFRTQSLRSVMPPVQSAATTTPQSDSQTVRYGARTKTDSVAAASDRNVAQNISDDDISSDVTVVYKDAATGDVKGRTALPKLDVRGLNRSKQASRPAVASAGASNKSPGVLELTERSVTPLHSPSTESFQSAISPRASP